MINLNPYLLEWERKEARRVNRDALEYAGMCVGGLVLVALLIAGAVLLFA